MMALIVHYPWIRVSLHPQTNKPLLRLWTRWKLSLIILNNNLITTKSKMKDLSLMRILMILLMTYRTINLIVEHIVNNFKYPPQLTYRKNIVNLNSYNNRRLYSKNATLSICLELKSYLVFVSLPETHVPVINFIVTNVTNKSIVL